MNAYIALCLVASVFALSQGTPTTPIPATSGRVTVAPDVLEQARSLKKFCKAKTGFTSITPVETSKGKDQAKIATTPRPKTELEKCYLECLYTGLQLTKDGKFNEPGARALANKRFKNAPEDLRKVNSIIDFCITEVVVRDINEKCALGRLIKECFSKYGAKNFPEL